MADSPASVPVRAGPASQSSAGDSPLLSLLPHILQLLRREPALAITLSYLLVAMAGIFYNYSFYRKFDIPVLSLSQISDFLAAGIQQPIALVLVLSTFPLCWLFDRLGMVHRRRKLAQRARLLGLPSLTRWQRWRLRVMGWNLDRPTWEQSTYLLMIVLYGWSFVGAYAQHRADAVKRGDATEVRIWLADKDSGLEQGRVWTWLGAIGGYVFVYDPATARSSIMPAESVARIEPVPAARRAAAAVAPGPAPSTPDLAPNP